MNERLEEARKPWNFGRKVFNWKPELHPRDRKGRFINVFKKILNMEVGQHYDLDKVIQDAPNIQQGTVWRNRDGWEVRTQTRQGIWGTQINNRDLLDNEDIFDDFLMVVNEGEHFPDTPLCPCGCGNKSPEGGLLPGHDARSRSRVQAKALRGDQKALRAALNSPAPFVDGPDDAPDPDLPEMRDVPEDVPERNVPEPDAPKADAPDPDPDRIEADLDEHNGWYRRLRYMFMDAKVGGGEEDWEEVLGQMESDSHYYDGDFSSEVQDAAYEFDDMWKWASAGGDPWNYLREMGWDVRDRPYMDRKKLISELLDADTGDPDGMYNDLKWLEPKILQDKDDLVHDAQLMGVPHPVTLDIDEFNLLRLRANSLTREQRVDLENKLRIRETEDAARFGAQFDDETRAIMGLPDPLPEEEQELPTSKIESSDIKEKAKNLDAEERPKYYSGKEEVEAAEDQRKKEIMDKYPKLWSPGPQGDDPFADMSTNDPFVKDETADTNVDVDPDDPFKDSEDPDDILDDALSDLMDDYDPMEEVYADRRARELEERARVKKALAEIQAGKPLSEVFSTLTPYPSKDLCACGCGNVLAGDPNRTNDFLPGHGSRMDVVQFDKASMGSVADMEEIKSDPNKYRKYRAWVSRAFPGTPQIDVPEIDQNFSPEELAYDASRIPEGIPLNYRHAPLLDPGPGELSQQLARLTVRRNRASSPIDRALLNETMRKLRSGSRYRTRIDLLDRHDKRMIDMQLDNPDLYGTDEFEVVDMPSAPRMDMELSRDTTQRRHTVFMDGSGLEGDYYHIQNIVTDAAFQHGDGSGFIGEAKIRNDFETIEDFETQIRAMGAFVGPSSLSGRGAIAPDKKMRNENAELIDRIETFSLSVWIPIADGKYVEYFPQVMDTSKVRSVGDVKDRRGDARLGQIDRLPEFDSPDAIDRDGQAEGFMHIPWANRGMLYFEGMTSSEIDNFLAEAFWGGASRETQGVPRLTHHKDDTFGAPIRLREEVADGSVIPEVDSSSGLVHTMSRAKENSEQMRQVFSSDGLMSQADRRRIRNNTRAARASRSGALKPRDLGVETGMDYSAEGMSPGGDLASGIDGYVFANFGTGISYGDPGTYVVMHPKHIYRDDVIVAPQDWGANNDRYYQYSNFMTAAGGAFGEGLPGEEMRKFTFGEPEYNKVEMGSWKGQVTKDNEINIPGGIDWSNMKAILFTDETMEAFGKRAMKEGKGKGRFNTNRGLNDMSPKWWEDREMAYQAFLKWLDRLDEVNPDLEIHFGERDHLYQINRDVNKSVGMHNFDRLPSVHEGITHAFAFNPKKVKESDQIYDLMDLDPDEVIPDKTGTVSHSIPYTYKSSRAYARAYDKVQEKINNDPRFDGLEATDWAIVPKWIMRTDDPEVEDKDLSKLIVPENSQGFMPVWYRHVLPPPIAATESLPEEERNGVMRELHEIMVEEIKDELPEEFFELDTMQQVSWFAYMPMLGWDSWYL